jgi:hypothetical protein
LAVLAVELSAVAVGIGAVALGPARTDNSRTIGWLFHNLFWCLVRHPVNPTREVLGKF